MKSQHILTNEKSAYSDQWNVSIFWPIKIQHILTNEKSAYSDQWKVSIFWPMKSQYMLTSEVSMRILSWHKAKDRRRELIIKIDCDWLISSDLLTEVYELNMALREDVNLKVSDLRFPPFRFFLIKDSHLNIFVYWGFVELLTETVTFGTLISIDVLGRWVGRRRPGTSGSSSPWARGNLL